MAIPDILSRRLLRRDFGPVQRLWPRGGLWRWWTLTQTKTFSTVTTKWWSKGRRTIYTGFFFRFLDLNSNGFFHLTQANFEANSAKFCFKLPISANSSRFFNQINLFQANLSITPSNFSLTQPKFSSNSLFLQFT